MKTLKFSPYAWRKMQYLRDIGGTEVSFMAITSRERLDIVLDVKMVKQRDSVAYTEFDEEGLADFFDDMVDDGLHPEQFGRIWCHTHPGNSATPSGTDHTTFGREFSAPDWAIMFILAKDDSCTCKLKYKTHPSLTNFVGANEHSEDIEVKIAWSAYCPMFNTPAVEADWKAEYDRCWSERTYTSRYNSGTQYSGPYSNHNSMWPNNGKPLVSTDSRGANRIYYSSDLYGPGWRWDTDKKCWFYNSKHFHQDQKENLDFSPDSYFGFRSYDEWKDAGSPSRAVCVSCINDKVPIPKRTPLQQYLDTQGKKKLNRREKKWYNQHKTMDGFMPPTNSGTKQDQSLVSLSKLECDRNLIGPSEQGDNDFDWLMDAQDAADGSMEVDGEIWREYSVSLKSVGIVVHNVWARDKEEAIVVAKQHFADLIKEAPLPEETKEVSISEDDVLNYISLETDLAQVQQFVDDVNADADRDAAIGDVTIPLLPVFKDDDTELELLPTNEGLANFSNHTREFAAEHGGTDPNPYNQSGDTPYDIFG